MATAIESTARSTASTVAPSGLLWTRGRPPWARRGQPGAFLDQPEGGELAEQVRDGRAVEPRHGRELRNGTGTPRSGSVRALHRGCDAEPPRSRPSAPPEAGRPDGRVGSADVAGPGLLGTPSYGPVCTPQRSAGRVSEHAEPAQQSLPACVRATIVTPFGHADPFRCVRPGELAIVCRQQGSGAPGGGSRTMAQW